MALLTFFILRETFRPLLLERKVKQLRQSTGDATLVSAMQHPHSGAEALVLSLTRPFRLLLFSPVVLLPTLGMGIMFGLFFLMVSTMATVFQKSYGFSLGASGLTYLGFAVGLFAGLALFALTSDRAYKALENPLPEARLAPVAIGAPLACISLLLYGWTIEKQVHWIVPIIGSTIFSLSMIAFIMPVSTYLIEIFHEYAAAPVGANSFLRSLLGGVLPLIAGRLFGNLGLGWGNTLLAFIALGFAPLPWLFYKNGEKLRERFPPAKHQF
jgi:MFS family permease